MWGSQHIDAQRRTEILDAVDRDGTAGPDYLLLTLLSCAIATFGLAQNSGPAIIGAMLIAPVLGPVLGFSLALVRGDPDRLARTFATLVVGAALVLCLSAVLGILIGLMGTIALSGAGVAQEVASRAHPSLLDLGVALAAGAASAYAVVQPRLPTALPGAILALVLVPPLCVMGIGLSQADVTLWRGAALLLIGNFSAAVVACAAVFALAGLRQPPPIRQPARTPRKAAASIPRVGSPNGIVLAILLIVLAASAVHAAGETQPDALHAPAPAATPSPSRTSSPATARTALPAATSALSTTVTLTPSPVPPAVRPKRGVTALVRDTHGFGANARQTPALNGAVLAVLPEGSTVQLTGRKAIADGFGWLEVLLPNGKRAWIATNFLGPAPPTATATPRATAMPHATARPRVTATP